MANEKYTELIERLTSDYKYYWERWQHCDYLIELYGEGDSDLVIDWERYRTTLEELGSLRKIAGVVIDTKWYEEKRAEIRKEVDSNADYYKERFGE